MRSPKENTEPSGNYALKLLLAGMLLLFFGVPSALAQNSKGDRPASSNSLRLFPKIKSKHKGGDRANTRDISGRRRIRTKNKSSASHIFYPARGPYVNNPSKKPSKAKIYTRTASGHAPIRTRPSSQQRAWTSNLKGQPIGSASASRPYITRGKKNVYWGKFSKGERPITKDLTGRSVRTRNFHSSPMGTGRTDTLKTANRKPSKEGSRFGKGRGGFVSISGNGRASTKDISGHAIRRRNGKRGGLGGFLFGGTRSASGRGNNTPLPVRQPGMGANAMSRRYGRMHGQPKFGYGGNVGGFRGNLQREDLLPAFGSSGGYAGNIKLKRPSRGGGSVSGRIFNNRGTPLNVRPPGGSQGVGKFQGNFQREDLAPQLSRGGAGYSGGIKLKRQGKGGGSISGKFLNNGGRPINVRPPGGFQGIGNFRGKFQREDLAPQLSRGGAGYSGNVKARRPLKGGGSISGKFLGNDHKPLAVRPPGPGSRPIGRYQGNFRREDLSPQITREGSGYSGNLKARRPQKGGGSISGTLLSNGGKPIAVRPPGQGSRGIGKFQGNFRREDLSPQINREGSGYSGNLRGPRKALHGGGSVSGRLWNNEEKPIAVKAPLSRDDKGYRIKLSLFKKYYIKNPHSDEDALKKRKPGDPTYAIGGLGVKTKQRPYVQNPNSNKLALKKSKPSEPTYAIGGLGVKTKQRPYVRNPNSSALALKKSKPSQNVYTIGGLGVKSKRPDYVHNPSSNKKALSTLAPGKAYARLKDYQGNIKMTKLHGSRLHPDAQFAHGNRDNVKGERSIKTNIKYFWAKFFKKQAGQPAIVKAKEHPPRYDRKEKDLWKALYD